MKKIHEIVELVDEELCGAKGYAEKYVEMKAAGDLNWASKFKAMANDELAHAMTIHEYAVEEINKLNAVYTAPAEMQAEWDASHTNYVEKAAWIKQMLTM